MEDSLSNIARAKRLLDAGILTEEEFVAEKTRLLSEFATTETEPESSGENLDRRKYVLVLGAILLVLGVYAAWVGFARSQASQSAGQNGNSFFSSSLTEESDEPDLGSSAAQSSPAAPSASATDDEADPEKYYYVDENGNLVDPANTSSPPSHAATENVDETGPQQSSDPSEAASDKFLEKSPGN